MMEFLAKSLHRLLYWGSLHELSTLYFYGVGLCQVTNCQIFKIRIHRNFFIRQQQSKQLVKVTMIGMIGVSSLPLSLSLAIFIIATLHN